MARVVDFRILGIEEVTEYFFQLGKVPQNSVKKAAKQGATLVRRKVQADTQLPVKYGFLRMSITSVEEGKKAGKRNKSGKAGFQVVFDNRFNSMFQKPIQRVGLYGGTKRTGYYPASMEYGFKTAEGGVGGHYFMKTVAMREQSAVQDRMIEVLSKDIDKIEKKRTAGGST